MKKRMIFVILLILTFAAADLYALDTAIVKACMRGIAYNWIDCASGAEMKNEKGEIAEFPLTVSKDGKSVAVSAPANEGFYQIFVYLSHTSKPLYAADFDPRSGLITLKPYVTINGFTFKGSTIYLDSSKFNLQW